MNNPDVTQVMVANVVTIDVDEPLSAARRKMVDKRIHHLPVTREGKLVGMLTSTDVLALGYADELGGVDGEPGLVEQILDRQHPIATIMTAEPVRVTTSATLADAAAHLSTGHFHAVPVVDDEDVPVGIVTSSDLARSLLTLLGRSAG